MPIALGPYHHSLGRPGMPPGPLRWRRTRPQVLNPNLDDRTSARLAGRNSPAPRPASDHHANNAAQTPPLRRGIGYMEVLSNDQGRICSVDANDFRAGTNPYLWPQIAMRYTALKPATRPRGDPTVQAAGGCGNSQCRRRPIPVAIDDHARVRPNGHNPQVVPRWAKTQWVANSGPRSAKFPRQLRGACTPGALPQPSRFAGTQAAKIFQRLHSLLRFRSRSMGFGSAWATVSRPFQAPPSRPTTPVSGVHPC